MTHLFLPKISTLRSSHQFVHRQDEANGGSLLILGSLSHALMITASPFPTLRPIPARRQATTAFSTCGYVDGDPLKPRIAPQGFNCRVDTLNGLWGFCPTTIRAATDCGLGGFCFDAGPCSTGCGRASLINNPKITTWTWYVLSELTFPLN